MGATATSTAANNGDARSAVAPIPPRRSETTGIDAKKAFARQAAEFLAQYGTAQGRAELVARSTRDLRRNAGLRHYLGLDDDQYERFLEMLAEHDLATRERMSRCSLDEHCKFPGVDQKTIDDQRRNVASMFGPDILDKYEFYQFSAAEREVVTELRGRLPDRSRLGDAQAEKLVRALYEENRSIMADARTSGGNVGNYNNILWAPMTSRGATEQNEVTMGFNMRLHARAAAVLTPDQLETYTDMYNHALEQIASTARMSGDDDR
jgi:hypothetical protein